MDVSHIRSGLTAKRRLNFSLSRPVLIAIAAVAGLVLLGLVIWMILAPATGRSSAAATTHLTPAQLDARDAQTGAIGSPLLWKVSGKDATVYLFGSLHYLRSKMNWMDQRLFHAFDSSSEVWFELAEVDHPQPYDLRQPAYMAARPVLVQGLSETEKGQLATLLNRYNYTLDDMARVKPGVMAAAIEELDTRAGGFDFDRGADSTLYKRAKDMKKPIKGMETFRDHYAYVNRMMMRDNGRGTQDLKDALAAHFGTAPVEDIHVLARYWRDGDQRAITASVARQRAGDPELDAVLLDERNTNWMPKLETLIAGDKTVFVTVGAFHLVGPGGLVAQLRAKGYTVERVDP